MSPEEYFSLMLISDKQKKKRILAALEWELWILGLFDEEFEDILNGTFVNNQEYYIDKIVNKYLEMTNVKVLDTDEYSKSVIDKAFRTATEVQETTYKNLITIPLQAEKDISTTTSNIFDNKLPLKKREVNKKEEENRKLAALIAGGAVIGSIILNNKNIKRWLGKERANLIALNEANWQFNNQEYFEAKNKFTKKTWHTALDERVRISHSVMEGVTVDINDYFIVGGYPMKYPLDDSAGAPISEIANCRCTVEYK